ncbi:BQ2448_2313 [Microbotryum intermedium]|uniref:BQ2448_2313 protein n=1 Tax=Microbotryum intermedium TaxID=269621 RepID=A0A238FBB1_9BASI|nr:BQ2448_2313 [Microbotryum intermedium]
MASGSPPSSVPYHRRFNESSSVVGAQSPPSRRSGGTQVAPRPRSPQQAAQPSTLTIRRTDEMFLFVPWPMPGAVKHGTCHSHNFVYGWKTHASGAVIAGALQAPTLAGAGGALSTLSRGSIQGPQILGTFSDSLAESLCDASFGTREGLDSLLEHSFVRLVIDTSVQPISPTCVSHPGAVVILYSPPSRRRYQYFALDSSQSALSFSATAFVTSCARSNVPSTATNLEKAFDKPAASALSCTSRRVLSLGASDFTSRFDPLSVDLCEAVEQINASNCVPPLNKGPIEHTPEAKLGPTIIKKTPMARAAPAPRPGRPWFSWCSLPLTRSAEVQELSATIQQLRLRFNQGIMLPSQYKLIKHAAHVTARGSDAHSLVCARVHYISCFNLLWLIANDVIVGIAIASFVCENHAVIGRRLGELLQMSNSAWLRELLMWLNDWPGGIKLNYELASMFSAAFLWASSKWDGQIIAPLTVFMPELVYLVGASGYGGTTLFLSVTSDVLSLLTLHLFVSYIFATSLFRWHIALLRAVFNIFRGVSHNRGYALRALVLIDVLPSWLTLLGLGKRYNTLRHRVEPAVYETDQLLLGTILFMLAAFLFPTVLAFYLAFATIRVAIIAFHALDEFMLAFMNGFPQFVLLLLLKDPARLPGVQADMARPLTMELLNQPIPASLVLSQHLHISLLLATHYSPKKFILHLLQGQSCTCARCFQPVTPLIDAWASLAGDLILPFPCARLRLLREV